MDKPNSLFSANPTGHSRSQKTTKSTSLATWEILLFGLLCTVDMISTIYWVGHGMATEQNPLLAYWLKKSVLAFCIAKLVSFVPLLVICAIYRKRYQTFIVKALRYAMIAYVGIYAAAVGAQLLASR